MDKDAYAVYGSKIKKKQKLFELVIYHDKPGIGYVKDEELISFMSRDELLHALDAGSYRYIND